MISSMSAHGDYEEMIHYLHCQDKAKVKKIFLVHGDPAAQDAFKGHLERVGFDQVVIPELGESFQLGE
jgi:metallo-beta-lactamase family protein